MDAESFWQNVSQVLKTKKISQEKMCEDIGISIWTLRGSISKKIFPRVDIAKNIADYLGTSIDFLLTGTETNPSSFILLPPQIPQNSLSSRTNIRNNAIQNGLFLFLFIFILLPSSFQIFIIESL